MAAACFIGVYITCSTGSIFISTFLILLIIEIYKIVANVCAYSHEKKMASGYCNDLTKFDFNLFYGCSLLDYGNELYRYHSVYGLGLSQ